MFSPNYDLGMQSNTFKKLSKQQKAILKVIINRPEAWPYCPSGYIKKELKIGNSKSELNSFSRSLQSMVRRGLIERLNRVKSYRIKGEKCWIDDLKSIDNLGIGKFEWGENEANKNCR